jgi:hypothetical protein
MCGTFRSSMLISSEMCSTFRWRMLICTVRCVAPSDHARWSWKQFPLHKLRDSVSLCMNMLLWFE